MFDRLRRDLKRYYAAESRDGSPGALEKLKIIAFSHGLQAVMVYRFGVWSGKIRPRWAKWPLRALHIGLNESLYALWGIYVHAGANIEGGLFIPHPSGIIIGRADIGEDCMIGQNATIGVRPGVNLESPKVGARVFIGPGAVVFGDIKIGEGTAIGPLTVVGRNLPPHCLAVGNPMQILKRNFDNSSLLYPDPSRAPGTPATSETTAGGTASETPPAADAAVTRAPTSAGGTPR